MLVLSGELTLPARVFEGFTCLKGDYLGVCEHLDPKEEVLERWDRDSTGQMPVELLGPAGVFSSSPMGLSIPPETSENAILATYSRLLI